MKKLLLQILATFLFLWTSQFAWADSTNGKLSSVSSWDGAVCSLVGGDIYCWGNGTNWRLGSNYAYDSSGEKPTKSIILFPQKLPLGKDLKGSKFSSVSVGRDHVCAITTGKAYCWGNNNYGAVGVDGEMKMPYVKEIQSTFGTLQVWEYPDNPVKSPMPVSTGGELAGKEITAISAGESHTCAVADGKAYCWGTWFEGELGNGTGNGNGEKFNPPLSYSKNRFPSAVSTEGALAGKTVTAISATAGYTCAIADGGVYCWGDAPGICETKVSGESDNSNFETCSKQNRFPVFMTGQGPLSKKKVTAISVGNTKVCVLADGNAYCWGSGDYEFGVDSSIAVSPHSPFVYGNGDVSAVTVTKDGSFGGDICAVRKQNIYCWGAGTFGSLGDGTGEPSYKPKLVKGLIKGKKIYELSTHDLGLCAVGNNDLYCWGPRWDGQLGDGKLKPSSKIPVRVTFPGQSSKLKALVCKTAYDSSKTYFSLKIDARWCSRVFWQGF